MMARSEVKTLEMPQDNKSKEGKQGENTNVPEPTQEARNGQSTLEAVT